ncbi:hypothetical protein K488DRAFT_79678 [Vararia minispora EC-137]|uniref:Uncharacterized protein n=1 Tax=Vararia minispora EC-137 TaxID=1314806 RepID=A0ACB8QF89_9AGAM|nr:hypothetical protein K488DRAFT_79678 [Vararia minispora EC-137]
MSGSPSPRSSTEFLVPETTSLYANEFPLPVVRQEWGIVREVPSPPPEEPDYLSLCVSRILAKIASRAPRLVASARHVADLIRGPESVVVLHGAQRVPLETIFLQRTHFLTSPVLLVALLPIYLFTISAILRAQSYSVPPEQVLTCTSTFWPAPYDRCGLDGEHCTPHSNASFSFKCPAECSTVYLHNPRIVGAEALVYEPLIVGGGDDQWTYRGDSWICAAAQQTGITSDYWGGCVTVDLVGTFTEFLPRTTNGLSSIGFPSAFPLSFRLSPNFSLSNCMDLRTPALIFNVLTTFVLFTALRPKPIVLYWSLVCIGFWHVTLFSQPRSHPPDIEFGFATFLPTLFVCHAFWECAVKWVLPPLVKRIPFEGAILYLGPWWITVLNNLTLDRLPVDRLMVGDIMKRAGGLATLFAGVVVVLAVLANQIMIMRQTGCLAKYLRWYGIGLGIVFVLALMPGLNLRVHHYIFAIVFIPGTAFPTRLSAILQGFLLGMFLNGVAAWGFDGILQTIEALRRDAPVGTSSPVFLRYDATSEVIRWASLPDGEGWDGFSLLVDDVERYNGPALNYSVQILKEGLPHFFRLAFTRAGERVGDWTMPATLWPNGSWIEPSSGSSY